MKKSKDPSSSRARFALNLRRIRGLLVNPEPIAWKRGNLEQNFEGDGVTSGTRRGDRQGTRRSDKRDGWDHRITGCWVGWTDWPRSGHFPCYTYVSTCIVHASRLKIR